MTESFGKLLRDCRMAAGLTQRELALLVSVDPSMICRYEKARPIPNQATLGAIASHLSARGVKPERLDELWKAAGYYRSDLFPEPVTDPVVALVNQALQQLGEEQRSWLSAELRGCVESYQAFSSASHTYQKRRYDLAAEQFLELRARDERRFQRTYLRNDIGAGLSYYSSGKYAEAIQFLQSAYWTATQLGDVDAQYQVLIHLGDTHRRRGGAEWPVALQRYEEAKQIALRQKDRLREAECLRKIAGTHLFEGRPDVALPLCEQSCSIFEKEGDWRGVYKALQHKGWAFDMLGRWTEATRLFEEALSGLKDMASDRWEEAIALRYLGDAYRIERRTREAEQTYKQALDILQSYENTGARARLVVGMIHLGLGKVYLRLPGRELEAQCCLNQSLTVHQGLGEDFRVAQVQSEQGELLLRLGRFEQAETYLMQAKDKLERLGNVFWYANVLATLCQLYFYKRDYDRIHAEARAILAADNGVIDCHLARIGLLEGKAYVEQGRFPDAWGSFCWASERGLKFNAVTYRELCGELLAEVDRIARQLTPDVALELCQAFLDFWAGHELRPDEQKAVEETVADIRRKREEVLALRPIQNSNGPNDPASESDLRRECHEPDTL